MTVKIWRGNWVHQEDMEFDEPNSGSILALTEAGLKKKMADFYLEECLSAYNPEPDSALKGKNEWVKKIRAIVLPMSWEERWQFVFKSDSSLEEFSIIPSSVEAEEVEVDDGEWIE